MYNNIFKNRITIGKGGNTDNNGRLNINLAHPNAQYSKLD